MNTIEEAKLQAYIELPSGCKPSEACSSDPTRPRLRHGCLRMHDDALWLYTSDSYIVCGLKVGGNATEGWVPRPVLEAIERGEYAEQVSPTAWKVAADSTVVTYDIAAQVGEAVFPNVAMFLHDDFEAGELQSIALNPELTVRLAKALGARSGQGVVLAFSGALRAFRVTPAEHPASERVGAQMPIRPL